MKRKTIALLLALMMCLALLSACGANDTPDTEEPPASVDTSAEQQPSDEKEDQPSQEPEESEEPVQEAPKEEEHAGTKLLALLQEEYKNGFVEGEGLKHTYLPNKLAVIYNGVIYINGNGNRNMTGWNGEKFSYDTASKEWHNANPSRFSFILDGNFYEIKSSESQVFDCDGTLLKSISISLDLSKFILFESGILAMCADKSTVLLSHSLEKIADIPNPQREVAHGLKEDINWSNVNGIAADGTVYLRSGSSGELLFRLNLDTYEWENVDTDLFKQAYVAAPFWGKYVVNGNSIYDNITGEEVFNCSEADVYPPISANQYRDDYLCYFGGDKYLGFQNKEYRWVNLTDLSMSDPLPFPESTLSFSDHMTILNDTYCVYYDGYGWFLLNYNTGAEETIRLFEQ